MLTDGVVQIRPIEKSDLSFLRDLANDPVVRRNVVGWDWPLSMNGQERWFDSGVETDRARRFMIELVGGTRVGLTGLWDIDWRNRSAVSAIKIGGSEPARGRGYGTRSLRLMTKFAFEDAGLNRLSAQILKSNESSLALYRDRNGWKVEGISREQIWRDGKYEDLVHLSILSREYRQRGEAE